MARVNHIRLEDDDVRAQEDYDGLFYELDSDTEGESTQWDFCRPLQCSGLPDQLSNPNSKKLEDTPRLEGTEGPNRPSGMETTQPSDSSLNLLTMYLSQTFSFNLDQGFIFNPQDSAKPENSKMPCLRNCGSLSCNFQ